MSLNKFLSSISIHIHPPAPSSFPCLLCPQNPPVIDILHVLPLPCQEEETALLLSSMNLSSGRPLLSSCPLAALQPALPKGSQLPGTKKGTILGSCLVTFWSSCAFQYTNLSNKLVAPKYSVSFVNMIGDRQTNTQDRAPLI